MFSVIIIPDGARSPAGEHRLEPGQTLRFGRTLPAGAGLSVPHSSVPRAAGELTATGAFWVLTNFSSALTYVVENPESAGERIRVAPGRADAPVPFEFARVILCESDRRAGFDVLAPRHDYLAHPEPPGPAGGFGPTVPDIPEARWAAPPATAGPGHDRVPGPAAGHGPEPAGPPGGPGLDEPLPLPCPLDRTRRYFLVLAALCEPRLRGDAAAPVPTPGELARRLRGVWPQVSERAVTWNLDYLALKLRLRMPGAPPPREGDEAGRSGWLAELALRFDLVREEHLGALDGELAPPDGPTGG
ncbi:MULTISPECIES: hypothetical protein [Streptomyces]|uniref:FHA domain-containing protein n=1 Tax=Streptomyces cacaoi TaxID=1898 RepID=A0A4Y3QWS4_STRCI|nr:MULTISPECIES: hypothetical protein [Streptomyces]GEB48878.1 hypothetical protein SCA03_14290 [Streptomyces cacaoi]